MNFCREMSPGELVEKLVEKILEVSLEKILKEFLRKHLEENPEKFLMVPLHDFLQKSLKEIMQ